MKITEKDKDRFWSKVDKRGPEDCWEWQAYRAKTGYGNFGIGRTVYLAHRISYHIATGQDPAGKVVRHAVCDNPPCVNPRHLLSGTHADNVRDKVRRNRHTKGETHGGATLTETLVTRMRQRARVGEPLKKIAEDEGVKYTTAVTAIRGVRGLWNHIEEKPVRPTRQSPKLRKEAA